MKNLIAFRRRVNFLEEVCIQEAEVEHFLKQPLCLVL